jgi:hypothetical protein
MITVPAALLPRRIDSFAGALLSGPGCMLRGENEHPSRLSIAHGIVGKVHLGILYTAALLPWAFDGKLRVAVLGR